MAEHILDIIERVRGRRPTTKSSFATIGVDSLGAVMFIKQLSDSLGGLRIKPTDLYAPGVTVGSFAEDLYRKLSTESPGVLDKLGIHGDDSAGLIEQGEGGGADEEEYEGQGVVQQLDSSFDEMLNGSRRLMEGLRGVFTFLVLYDHFHHIKDEPINDAFLADTYLFVLISGITTAFQLRETPRFDLSGRTLTTTINVNANTDTDTAHGASAKGSPTPGYLRLAPRTGFNLRKFIISRLVGLYPILWIGLALNAPPWDDQTHDPKRGGPSVKIPCVIMYTVGMQSWWRPQCSDYGPNNMLYASLLVNIFIIYGIGRKFVIEPLQTLVMGWASPEVDPVTLRPPPAVLAKRGWRQWLGDTAVLFAYNRTDASMIGWVMLFFFSCTWFFGHIMLRFTYAKNSLVFVPYFMIGVFFSACTESVHYALWDHGRRLSGGSVAAGSAAESGRSSSTDPANDGGLVQADRGVIPFLYKVIRYSDDRACAFPWVHQRWWLTWLYVSAPPLTPTRYEPAADDKLTPATSQHVLPEQSRGGESTPSAQNARPLSTAAKAAHYVFRFIPDGLAALFAVCLSPAIPRATATSDPQGWLWFVGLPTIFLAMLFVFLFQCGSARFCLSRWLLETTPITTMGYASYAIYLFQRIIFSFYLPLIFVGGRKRDVGSNGKPNMLIGNGNPYRGGPWFETLDLGYKFLAFVFLVTMCWLTHKYVQDQFVAWLYAKALGSKCCRAGTAGTAGSLVTA